MMGRPARRIVVRRPGGAAALQVEAFDVPAPGPGEITVEVAAAGVNFADVFCRLGLYAAAPPRPFAPGFEVAGTVAAIGVDVDGWSVGDRAVAVTRFGGYATRVNVDAGFAKPLPRDWSLAQGAGFPVVFLTAWYALFEVGRLEAGNTVVVQSAAGGVGMAACQLARATGARVIGTVGSERKRQAARDAGAADVVVSPAYDVWREIGELTGGAGVDLVLDAVGGPRLRDAYRALKPCGRLVVYGFAGITPRGGVRNWPVLAWRRVRTARFDPFRLVSENRTVSGFNLVHLWHRRDLFDRALASMLAMTAGGQIRPLPTTEVPFERPWDAHELLQSRRSTGKIVLRVQDQAGPDLAPGMID